MEAEIVIESGIIVATSTDISAVVFSGREQSQKIMERLRKEASSLKPDVSTKAGRDAIASNAYKVSKSKVVLLKMADTLTEEWKKKTKVVTLEKSFFEKECDLLRDEIRAPLTKWEEEEKARIEAERLAAQIILDEEEAYKEHALFLRMKEIEAKEAELARIEAERLAKEEEERQELARIESERIRKEEEIARIKAAEEKARIEAEAKAAAEIEAARQREIAAKIEAERQKQEAEQAALKAEAARIMAEKQAKEEKEKAVKEAEERARIAAEMAEAKRIAAEEAARREEEKKAANKEHRRIINGEALKGFIASGLTDKQGKDLISHIINGNIPHVTINY